MSSENQHTLAQPSSIAGTSLHTGEQVTLTIKPAPADNGIQFRRIDLDDQPFILASVDNVQKVERATTLAAGSVKVHTVEHVISALAGMGVDNAIVEMDANEPPIGDGSAKPFVDAIKKAGLEEQDKPRRIYDVREPIHQEVGDGSLMTIVPDKKFRVSCTQVGPDGRMTQYFSVEVNPETYEKEIAPARTFVFYEDVEPLLTKGLIKGGSLENAIVVRDDSIMSKEPMRFDNEFARHKVLDVIGDLLLSGKRIRGHVICVKPGHGANTEMARQLKRQYDEMAAAVPSINIPQGDGVLEIEEVKKILPHRYPFLMVDRILGFEGDKKCRGLKQVSINEEYFNGHFPNHPVMPGVLQLEAMAQVASVLLLRMSENMGKIGYFMSADKVKFRRPVRPGDSLIIETEIIKMRSKIGFAAARCLVNDQVCSEAELKFAVMDV
jgi:UDP-3-O-[3-hydroxymyristoyl] N-acetylglucosamine deacetylase/3-hydroxyacyl-[acyl-carrier-protein] dehydratase